MRWVALVVLLAGCSSTAPAAPDEAAPDAPIDIVAAPEWQVGDYWTFDFDARFQGTASLVVTSMDASSYIVESNEPQLAYIDAQGDASMIGPQRRSDLAGSQGPTIVEFLRFPLQDGLRWSTTWDGVERDILAKDLGGGRFELTATEADGFVAVTYTYDHAKKWVTEWRFEQRAGEPRILSLASSGSDFTGTIYRYELGDALRVELVGQGTSEAEWTLGDGVTELGIVGHADCGGSGPLYAAVRAPQDGQQPPTPLGPVVGNADWEHNVACPGGGDTAVDITLPGAAGPWQFRAVSASEGSSVVLDLEPRTLIAVPFPS